MERDNGREKCDGFSGTCIKDTGQNQRRVGSRVGGGDGWSGGVVGKKWTQLYLNNSKKRKKEKKIGNSKSDVLL